MPKQSFVKTFIFNMSHKAQAEHFRWRMRHCDRTPNCVELQCRVTDKQQIEIEIAFESRRSMDWAEGFAFGLFYQNYFREINSHPVKL